MAIKTVPGISGKWSLVSFSFLAALSVFGLIYLFEISANYDPGEIIDGTNTVLNPDGGSFMSNLSGDVTWTATDNEFTQFEIVSGVGGANVSWRVLENAGTEPTGNEDPDDISAGGNCGNSDIVVDSDGGFDYAYYSIIDPDLIADNGDEVLAFAIRIANKVSGAFTFSLLLDAGNDIGSDVNEVCGNPGFEYEIQISTQGNQVNLFNIDGCAGNSDCDALNGGGSTAIVCEPCNTGAIQVRAASSACTANNLDPVFWMGHIPFSQLAGVNASDNFRLVVATTTSPNEVIYKGTNVSDYGGIGDPNNVSDCDCAAECSGSSCSDCERDCAFSCAVTQPNPFPVEWLGLEGLVADDHVVIQWITASELNNHYFEVEQYKPESGYTSLGKVEGGGTSDLPQTYTFTTPVSSEKETYYRIKQVDFDGKSSYSNVIEVSSVELFFTWNVFFNPNEDQIEVSLQAQQATDIELNLFSINGVEMSRQKITIEGGQSKFQVQTAGLSNGVYLIKVMDAESQQTRTKQVVISR